MKCQYCGRGMESPRRKYCSDRCNNLASQARRYRSDEAFRNKRRLCWKAYVRQCAICGNPMRQKDRCYHGIPMIADNQSLFGSVEGRAKAVAIMASQRCSDPEEIFKLMRKDPISVGITDERLKKIIEEVLAL